jgi:carboxylesterase type B
MIIFFFLAFFYLITFSNADFNKCNSIPSESPLKIAQTLNGQVRGECKIIPVSYSNSTKISSDVFSWLSIPFAEPPINTNRFKRPIPISNWSNIKNATQLPNSCMQTDMNEANSEDCLYLNVYSRSDVYLNKDTSLQPVLVWIHGGGFTSGSTRVPLYEPSTIVAMSGIVVVTIQYRLDVFGFIRLEGTDATGNQGLLDQNLALKWVFENIRNFGGDPSKITIQGESAGASSVGYHLLYPGSWPYFKNAIVQSVWQCKFLIRPYT